MRNYGFKFDSGDSSQDPLGKPENFAYQWTPSDLTLSWIEVDMATGYQIQFSTDGTNWQLLSEVSENSYVYPAPSHNRYYRVCATNDLENSVWSETIEFDPGENQNDNV